MENPQVWFYVALNLTVLFTSLMMHCFLYLQVWYDAILLEFYTTFATEFYSAQESARWYVSEREQKSIFKVVRYSSGPLLKIVKHKSGVLVYSTRRDDGKKCNNMFINSPTLRIKFVLSSWCYFRVSFYK